MKNSILGIKIEEMSEESQRLYVLIKLVSQLKPNSKQEVLDSYDSAINEMIEEYRSSGNEKAFELAEKLSDMKLFVEEHIEDLTIDGLNKVDWSK